MKKQVFSIAGVALAVAMAAPTASAEAQAYLSLRPTLESKSVDGKRTTKVDDYFSRFGFKGDRKFGDLTVGLHGEWRAQDEESGLGKARQRYGFVAGDFGKVRFGQATGSMNAVLGGVTALGWSHGASWAVDVPGRPENMIRYTYKADALTVDASVRRTSKEDNGVELAGKYKAGSVTVYAGVSTEKSGAEAAIVAGDIITKDGKKVVAQAADAKVKKAADDVTRYGAGISYEQGKVTLGAVYFAVDTDKALATAKDTKESAIEFAAKYQLTKKLALDAVVTKFDDNSKKRDMAYAVGAAYKVAPNLLAFTAYEAVTSEEAGKKDETLATIGLKFDLNIMSAMGNN